MDKRILAMLSLALVAVMVLAPVGADQADAADAGSIHITMPGHDTVQTVQVAVGNGATESFTLYVYNDSDSYLTFDASGDSSSGYVDVTTEVSTNTILPSGASESGHIAEVTVSVSVDQYDDSPAETGEVVLYFTDMREGGMFTITIPIDIDVDSSYFSPDGTNKFLGVFPNTFDGIMGSEWVTAVVTLIAWIVISYVVCLILIPLFVRIFSHKSSDDEKRKLRKNLTSLIVLLIAVLAINQCLTIVGVSPEMREGVELLSSILYIVIGALMAWTVFVFVVKLLIGGIEKGSDSAIDSSLIPLFKMIGKIVICVCAAAAILALFGVDLNGILVSAGVITLGITLGAQNILNQFFSGIVLLSTRPFKRGDFVKIGGEVYIVRKVKLMFTEFDNWDKDQVVTIPNNVVSGGTIVNMTSEDTEARAYVYVKVAYGADIDKARELMVQAAMEHPHVIKDGSRSMPSTRLTNVVGNAIELRLAAYTDDFDSAGGYEGELRTRIYQLFDENGIQLPPNAMDIHIQRDDKEQ